MKPLLKWLAAAALLLAPGLGLGADDKVAGLVKDLSTSGDESVRLNATLALGQLGKDAVGPVGAALGSSDADTRYYALWALGLLGAEARGKTHDVIKLFDDKNEQVRRKAIFALGRIAPSPADALPQLVKALADDSPSILEEARRAATSFGKAAVPALTEALRSPNARVRNHAATALGQIGPDARDALPALAARLKDEDQLVILAAAQALAQLGQVSLPALAEAIKSDNAAARQQAVEAVAMIKGAEAVSLLVDALKSPHADVRRSAARFLGWLRVNDKLIVLSLAEVLKTDKDEQARLEAVRALANLGVGPDTLVPLVARSLADDNPNVRQSVLHLLKSFRVDPLQAVAEHFDKPGPRVWIVAAAMTVQQIDNTHAQALTILANGLKDAEPENRHRAAVGLALARKTPGDTVAILVEALKNKKAEIRGQAAQALGQVDDSKTVVPALADLLKDGDANVRTQAVGAMTRFSRDAVPHLTEATKDQNADVRRSAIIGLCAADGEAKTVVPVLTALLQDPEHGVRQQVLSGAFRLGHEALLLYMAALKDKEPSVRWVAASYMGQFPSGGRPLRDALIAAAKTDSDGTVRFRATNALASLGEDVIPALAELAKEDDLLVLQHAMQGLQRYGAKSKAAVPVLIEVLRDGKGDARWLAAQTLGAIGPDARDALNALREAAKDPNATLQSQATQAIGRIENK